MNENNHANTFVPAIPDRSDTRARTVNADNTGAPPLVIALAFAVVAGGTPLSWWVVRGVLRDTTRFHNGFIQLLAITVALAFFYFVGRFALKISSGDWVAEREVVEVEKTERKRVGAAANAYDQWIMLEERKVDLEQIKEGNRHLERMTEIQASHRLDQMDQRMLMLEDFARRGELPAPTAAPSFTPANKREAIEHARTFAESLYVDGKPDPAKVHAKGSLQVRTPWRKDGGEWNGEPWRDNAVDILTSEYQHLQPLIRPHLVNGKPRGYILNVSAYPTTTHLIELFDYVLGSPYPNA